MRKLTLFFTGYGIALFTIFHFKLPIDMFLAMVSLFLFCGIIAAFAEYATSVREFKTSLDGHMERKEGLKKRLSLEEQALDDYTSDLRQKETMIASLFEVTAKMSNNLTFNGIFRVLSAFLKDNFAFRKAELLILKEGAAGMRVEKAYTVYKDDDEPSRDEPPEDGYAKVLNLFTDDKKEVFMLKETYTFSAIPLLSENKFVGILTVENLTKADFDKLVIVAAQFALEMKKVLLYETVEELAITDSLTGLYARRYFFGRLNEELQRSKRHAFRFAFLMIDIDNFKACNDAHGHLVGDVILRDAARLIKESVREIDLAARYGGEEFSLVLPETDRSGARLAADRIRKKIEEHVFRAYDEKLKVTVSVGLAVYPDDCEEASDLIEKADKALYVAKNSGKNIVCEYKE